MPGRERPVGGTAADNRLFVEARSFQIIERACHGAIFRSASAIGKSSTSALADAGQERSF